MAEFRNRLSVALIIGGILVFLVSIIFYSPRVLVSRLDPVLLYYTLLGIGLAMVITGETERKLNAIGNVLIERNWKRKEGFAALAETDMWNLDHETNFVRVHSFDFPEAFTWGQDYRSKRERIPAFAFENFPKDIPQVKWWAFRIYVRKSLSGNKRFDIENIPKLIVDSFSKWQIQEEVSHYTGLGLFEDDTIESVRMIEVRGEPVSGPNTTRVDIFGRKR